MSNVIVIKEPVTEIITIGDSDVIVIKEQAVDIINAGTQGPEGIPGISAYEVAVDEGFAGTEQEWLDSLVGTDGADGDQGIQGIQGNPGIQGVQGIQGIQGDQGIQGIQGEQGDPGTFVGTMDDITDGTTYVKTENNLTDALAANIHAPGSDAETATSVATIIDAATAENPLVDTDTVPLTRAGALIKTLWSTIKSTLKTYFDGLYATIASLASYLPLIGGTISGNLTLATTLIDEGLPTLTAAGWTTGSGWSWLTSPNRATKNNDGLGTLTPTAATTIVAGKTYKVTIIVDSISVSTATYTLGGVSGSLLSAAGTYTDYITTDSTAKLLISPTLTGLRIVISSIIIEALTNAMGDLTIDGNLTLKSPILLPNGLVAIAINADGKIGIGTTANYKTDIKIDDAITNAITYGLRISHTTTGTAVAGIGTGILFSLERSSGALVNAAAINCILTSVSSNESGALTFSTVNAGSGMIERVRIMSTGFMGIRTTSPLRALDINEDAGNCLRLIYNDADGSAANYVDFLVSSAGDLTITPSGGDANLTGTLTATQFKLSALNTAPANAGDTGTLGEIRIVNGFIYICVATNTWQRTALATW